MNKKIFASDKRAVVVALEHGIEAVMQHTETGGRAFAEIIEAKPDAVALTFGDLKHYRELLEGKVATLLRLDGGRSPSKQRRSGAAKPWRSLYSIEDALRLGASGVVLSAWYGTPSEMDSVEMVAKAASDSQKYGLSLCVEIPAQAPVKAKDEAVVDAKLESALCRLAYEQGADLIKTQYTGDPKSFRQVTMACPVPVLVDEKAYGESDQALLQMTHDALAVGGRGIWCDCHLLQQQHPLAMLHVLVEMVHYGATVEEALKELKGLAGHAFFPT